MIYLYRNSFQKLVTLNDAQCIMTEVGDQRWHSIPCILIKSWILIFKMNYTIYIILKGTAEVVFSRRADAVTATKRYNNVQLDGNPMKIEIIGTNLQTPVTSNKVSSEPPLAGKFGPGPVEM